MANWRDILSQVRRFTGDAFRASNGYTSARNLNFGQRMAVLKYYRKIEELTVYGYATVKPKRGEKRVLFEHTGQTGYRKFDRAIIKTPRTGAKIKVEIDRSRPKGSQVVLKDERARRHSTYYTVPAEAIMDAIDEADDNDERPGDYIENVIKEYAPDATFVLIRTDNYYAWGMSFGAHGQTKNIGERIYQLMMDYGTDKFDPNDKNSSYFGNWFRGVTAFTDFDDAEPIIQAGMKRRDEYNAKHRRLRSRDLDRDKFKETKDGRWAHFHDGRFQGMINTSYNADIAVEFAQGWNAYIDGKIREDNPYHPVNQRIEYIRWLKGFNRAEEERTMTGRIQRR